MKILLGLARVDDDKAVLGEPDKELVNQVKDPVTKAANCRVMPFSLAVVLSLAVVQGPQDVLHHLAHGRTMLDQPRLLLLLLLLQLLHIMRQGLASLPAAKQRKGKEEKTRA